MALQIQQLHKLSRERDIKLRLGKMPNTLDKAYHEIYDRIQSADGSAPEVAKRAFQWIMCSEKLMSPAMLVAAVCQDPNTDDIDIVDIDFDFVLESCQNLLKVEIAEKEAVCRFSHLSVQEYLEKNHSSPLSNDVLVAQVCLTFLTSSTYPTPSTLSLERAEEESEETNKSREVEENGMKEIIAYASTHWLIHVQRSGEVEGDFDNRLITLLKRFLGTGAETTPAYKVWHRARVTAESRYSFEIRSVHSRYSLSIDWLRPISTLAIQIAMFGLHRMLHDSWEYVEPGQENTRGQPLLVIAAYGGCASMVLSLLDKGAKIDASSTESPSALYEASERGQNSVVKVLVENDANVNISGGFYSNALQVASMKGHTSIVEMLLAGGANVNAQGGKYGNALQAALMRGHTSIVKLLLVNGAHVNVQRGMYHNALQVASMGGHAVIVEFLLVNGTNVNAQKGKYHNAFQAVSMMGHALLMKLLFTDEANVNAQGEPHHNALQAASNRGFEGVVRILLKYGAFDRDNGALMVAASRGHESIVAILLQTSTSSLNDILIAACKGKTAYGKSHDNIQGVVNKLLDAGAVDPQGKALIKAAGQGYTSAVARLLKEHNAGLDEALVSACRLHTFEYSKKTQEDAEAIVMLLLNAGAMDRKGHALQEATKSGFAEVAALLREAAEKTNDRISENAENLSDERISLKGAIDGSET